MGRLAPCSGRTTENLNSVNGFAVYRHLGSLVCYSAVRSKIAGEDTPQPSITSPRLQVKPGQPAQAYLGTPYAESPGGRRLEIGAHLMGAWLRDMP